MDQTLGANAGFRTVLHQVCRATPRAVPCSLTEGISALRQRGELNDSSVGSGFQMRASMLSGSEALAALIKLSCDRTIVSHRAISGGLRPKAGR